MKPAAPVQSATKNRNNSYRFTARHFIFLEARQEPIRRVLDPRKHNDRQIINIHPNMTFEPDCTDMFPHDLRTGSKESATRCRSSVESEKEGDEVNYCRFAVGGEAEGI